MTLYHVTSAKKFDRYRQQGVILPPVRAWKFIESAERFSKQTGRPIIIRLKSTPDFEPYEGHRNEAVVSHKTYQLPKELS